MREVVEAAAAELVSSGNLHGRRDAELLMMHLTDRNRAFLLTHPEWLLSESQLAHYGEMIARRRLSEPLQYITGEREFYGLRFMVTPEVLIPRPETEHLVEAALERIPENQEFRVADVGTGSGAIAVSIAVSRPRAHISATDISPAALRIAQQNAAAHGAVDRMDFREADLLDGCAAGSLDVVVSNPPYIAETERESLAAEVRDYEPAGALFAGITGLEVYERLIPQAARALKAGGWLLLEIGAGQREQIEGLLAGWDGVSFVPDLQGIARVVIAQRW